MLLKLADSVYVYDILAKFDLNKANSPRAHQVFSGLKKRFTFVPMPRLVFKPFIIKLMSDQQLDYLYIINYAEVEIVFGAFLTKVSVIVA